MSCSCNILKIRFSPLWQLSFLAVHILQKLVVCTKKQLLRHLMLKWQLHGMRCCWMLKIIMRTSVDKKTTDWNSLHQILVSTTVCLSKVDPSRPLVPLFYPICRQPPRSKILPWIFPRMRPNLPEMVLQLPLDCPKVCDELDCLVVSYFCVKIKIKHIFPVNQTETTTNRQLQEI